LDAHYLKRDQSLAVSAIASSKCEQNFKMKFKPLPDRLSFHPPGGKNLANQHCNDGG